MIKQGKKDLKENCCSKFRYNFGGSCCCQWLTGDFSQFPFQFSSDFNYGKDETWTCGECEYGFICQD